MGKGGRGGRENGKGGKVGYFEFVYKITGGPDGSPVRNFCSYYRWSPALNDPEFLMWDP